MMVHRFDKKIQGFTLIEMTIVLILVGIVISTISTILPSLISTGKSKQTVAMLARADNALQGYLVANNRLPCPDTDSDGLEDGGGATDCTNYVGDLPFVTLGLSGGGDTWQNPIRYGVYGIAAGTDLTDDFADPTATCTAITAAVSAMGAGLDTTLIYTADDSADANGSNQSYMLVSGGAQDEDGAGGFFDDLNGDGTATRFNSSAKTHNANYDDLVISRPLTTLGGSDYFNCAGGGGGGGSTTAEVCNVAGDEDSNGFADCFDQACYGQAGPAGDPNLIGGLCPGGSPTGAVQLGTSNPADATLGEIGYSHSFSVSGGSGEYYFYLDAVSPAIPGLLINLWTGVLSGDISVCDGSYDITVRAEDRQDALLTDSHIYTLTVNTGTVTITPAPTGLSSPPDFTVDSSSFNQFFEANGAQIGNFNWALNWSSSDPNGFQIDQTSATRGNLWKSGLPNVGTYAFTLQATDSSCPNNSITTNSYSMEITPAGATLPYSANMTAEWNFDECSWAGIAGEVIDSSSIATSNGTATGAGGVPLTLGSGRVCSAGSFDGIDDYVDIGDGTASPDINTLFSNGSSAFTIAMWVNPAALTAAATDHSTQNTIFAKASDSFNDNLEIGINDNGTVHLYLDTTAQDRFANFGSATPGDNGNVALNEWSFVAISYDSGVVAVTINDTRYEDLTTWAGASTIDAAVGSPVTIGSSQHIDNYFNGRIDEVRVWNSALTDMEIAAARGITRSSCIGSCYVNPVAEYQMELDFPWNGTADEVNDSHGSNHGVASSFGTGVQASQTSASQGKICRSGSFTRIDGNNGSYLDMGDPASGELDPGTNPMTITAWFRWDGSAGENIIYNKESLYEARVISGYVNYAWQPNWAWDGGTSFPVTAGVWHHIATVYDGKEQILYKDGVQVFSRAQTGVMGSTANIFRVGARGSIATAYNFFGGEIDEVRVYQRALSETEISQMVTATRDCGATSVVITGLTPSSVTIGDTLTTGTGLMPSVTGGTAPYVWNLISSDIAGLSMPDLATGELEGTIDACAGTRNVTLGVADSTLLLDEQTIPIIVSNGTLAVSPASSTINCSTATCSQDFSVSGPHIGDIDNWNIVWQGTNPGGFELYNTGANTVRFRKIGTSVAGNGYRFSLTANDATCVDNALDSGFSYTLNITGSGTDTPYYAGMTGEWLLDETSWDSDALTMDIIDSSSTGGHGTSTTTVGGGLSAISTASRQSGAICNGAALNLNGVTNEYLSMSQLPFQNLDDFSISTWFKIDTLSSSLNTIFSGSDGSQHNSVILYITPAGDQIRTYTSGISAGGFNLGSSLADDQWHHVTWTRNATTGIETLHLDGTTYADTNGAASTTQITLTSSGAIIGQEQDSLGGGFATNQLFSGWIDEVRVHNKALSLAEADTLRNRTHNCSYTAPQALWAMDEADWSVAPPQVADSIGSAHGTVNGTTPVTAAGTLCNAGSFNGSDNYIYAPIDVSEGPYSAAIWINSSTTNRGIFQITDGAPASAGGNDRNIYIDGSGNICHRVWNLETICSSGTNFADGTWHHISVVVDTYRHHLFVDGINVNTGTQGSSDFSTQTHAHIGFSRTPNNYFDGLIDEVHIYDRALSNSEVFQIMNETRVCP